MSIEVTCPACGGSIQIEKVAEVVACPLCQVHLQVDPETSEPVLVSLDADEEADPPAAEASETETADAETETQAEPVAEVDSETASEESASEETTADEETASPFSFLPGANQTRKTEKRETPKFDFLPGGANESADNDTAEVAEPESSTDEAIEAEAEVASTETTADAESETAAGSTDGESEEQPAGTATASPFSFLPGGSNDEQTTEEATAETETATEDTTADAAETATDAEETSEAAVSETPAPVETAATESTTAAPEPAASPAPQSYRKPKTVSKRLFTLTLTYAIAATIMVAMLLYAKYQGDPHQLESLPDLKPPIKNDEIALQLVPENAELPPGHTLQLGGPGRRFGNVMVTPLRVTRGPLEFEHYTGDASRTREPTSSDVLKLYLKFENMSDDQTFEPLDQKLLLSRVPGKNPDSPMRANNFVSRVDQLHPDGERVLVYDMPPSWEWNIKGQNINQESTPQKLEPGQSFETFVATNEAGIDSLTGELVWRLQIRKGYNPKSHRGVTTLIDVVFNSDQIQKEVPSESKAPLPTS
ncbi:hypothetical protein [Gimesia chilikensis]|uniref:hypothetical protein n=1 Tax=Gimesia chilikensis TaxID=2605989 RepID=UPI00118AE3E4|nr:hypothetical protein [Gimesia chilikensis]QDT87854.1 hypothetical protein MalM14_55430 [Gimesia chilikensis]